MAIYPRLSLKYGGGIISSQQQGEQVKNTATILIGLGGTGLDCLKAIKAAVKERLRPDDPEAAVPEYSHIQFLGVDSDQVALSNGGMFGHFRAYALRNGRKPGFLKDASGASVDR